MRKGLFIIILLTGVFNVAARTSFAQTPSPVTAQPLELNKPIERELKDGETHAYTVTLHAGEFLRATVDQRGIDLVVRLFGPDGAKLAEVDSPNGDSGPEPVALEAKTAGVYRIDVAPDRQTTAIAVREGEAIVALAGGSQQTLPGQTAVVTGPDPAYADVRNGVGQDDDEVRTGNAMVIDCYGRIINESNAIGDEMVIADLDAGLRERCTGVRWIKARRPELYEGLSVRTGREMDTRAVRFEYDKTDV